MKTHEVARRSVHSVSMKRWMLFIAALAVGSNHCGNDKLPKYSVLDRLRVVALIADHPEVAPGGSVTISPWVSDIKGAGRALTYAVEACLDPGIGSGALPSCDGSATRVVLAQNASVTGISAPEYTGIAPTFTVVTPAAQIIFLKRADTEQYNGVAYLVTYTVSSSDGQKDRAFRRIVVSTRPFQNVNPVLSRILASGEELTTALPPANVSISPDVTTTSPEDYQVKDSNGVLQSRKEQITTSWLASDGALNRSRTVSPDLNDYTPPTAKPAGRGVILIGVTRDDRGGESVKKLVLN
ncbi:MAG: hypothetical protein H7222_11360 [Methylotenera sp.]|nr:hypothetical protein [Oligoflexia bacterium]